MPGFNPCAYQEVKIMVSKFAFKCNLYQNLLSNATCTATDGRTTAATRAAGRAAARSAARIAAHKGGRGGGTAAALGAKELGLIRAVGVFFAVDKGGYTTYTTVGLCRLNQVDP
jgi:hypothetical protein